MIIILVLHVGKLVCSFSLCLYSWICKIMQGNYSMRLITWLDLKVNLEPNAMCYSFKLFHYKQNNHSPLVCHLQNSQRASPLHQDQLTTHQILFQPLNWIQCKQLITGSYNIIHSVDCWKNSLLSVSHNSKNSFWVTDQPDQYRYYLRMTTSGNFD